MIYVPPTIEYKGPHPSIFLAGGISDCRSWQQQMVEMLAGTKLAVLNPRWADWHSKDLDAGERQIAWEFRHLHSATARLFWFPMETLCPIALFELGGWTRGQEPLFVGMDPAYRRRLDVEIQLKLARPEVKIAYRLPDLAQVLAWEKTL